MPDVVLTTGVDTSGGKAGLAELRSHAQKAGADIRSAFAGTFAIAGLGAAIKGLIDYGDRIYDLGQRFGVSTDALQKFGNAAEKEGSSLEGMAMGFNKLIIAQSKALGGSSEMIQHFANLGITIEDLRKLSPEELMLKLGSSSLNAADMVALLGRNALELRPVLKGLADGTVQMGTAIDAVNIKRLADASDTFKDLGERARILGAMLIGPILKGIDEVGDAFAELKVIGVSTWDAILAAAKGDMAGVKAAAQAQLDAISGKLYEQRKAAREAGRSKTRSGASDLGGLDEGGGPSSSTASGRGGGRATTSEAALQERINKLQEEHLEKTRTAEENLNALKARRLELQAQEAVFSAAQRSTGLRAYSEQAAGDADHRKALENQEALAKNTLEIDKAQELVQKEQRETLKEIVKLREAAADAAERAGRAVAAEAAAEAAKLERLAGRFNNERSGISPEEQQRMRESGMSEQQIAALGGKGTGIASEGSSVTWQEDALIMATDPTTGKVDQRQLEINRARQQLALLQGKPSPWGAVEIMARKKAYALGFGRTQANQQKQQAKADLDAQIRYWQNIAAGHPEWNDLPPDGSASGASATAGSGAAGAIGSGSGLAVGDSAGGGQIPSIPSVGGGGAGGALSPLHPQLASMLGQILRILESTHVEIKGPPGG